MNLADLRRSPLFAGLTDDDLNQLVSKSETVGLACGEMLMEQGAAGDAAYVILDGELEVFLRSGRQIMPIAKRGPGEVIGEMALVDQAPRSASVRALQDSHLLRIPQATFDGLLATSTTAALAILRTVMDRLRNREALLLHSEKMAALGTLSAGLAHELNNPAAAAQRGAAHLQGALQDWLRLTGELYQTLAPDSQETRLETLFAQVSQQAAAAPPLDPLERSDRSDGLQSWLEAHGVQDAWQLAPALVSAGWEADTLAALIGELHPVEGGQELENIVRWVEASASLNAMLDEISQSTARLAQIVKAVKSYTYLDQAPVQEVDVHEGLEDTLVILRHKLKDGITIHRHYDRQLPRIEAYASELNQVWTNIIDNAIDAMQGNGELTLRTYPADARVVVEISDNGPGIPPEKQARIFDAFFTTKPPGSGMGLGLHIAYNIVAHRHQGQIKVRSQPGETCFQVTLPIRLEPVEGTG